MATAGLLFTCISRPSGRHVCVCELHDVGRLLDHVEHVLARSRELWPPRRSKEYWRAMLATLALQLDGAAARTWVMASRSRGVASFTSDGEEMLLEGASEHRRRIDPSVHWRAAVSWRLCSARASRRPSSSRIMPSRPAARIISPIGRHGTETFFDLAI